MENLEGGDHKLLEKEWGRIWCEGFPREGPETLESSLRAGL